MSGLAEATRERIAADVAIIEAAIQQLGQGYRDLHAAHRELMQDAHSKGRSVNAAFSDVHIRDLVASALFRAGAGDLLDVGSSRDHSGPPLSELVARLVPGAASPTRSGDARPPSGRDVQRDHRGRVIGEEASEISGRHSPTKNND